MQAIAITLVLFGGGPYVVEDSSPAAPPQHEGQPCRGANSPAGPVVDWRQATSLPLWRWGAYVVRSDYSPGCLRDPTGSWFKHPYLAYRGNYYRQGFDYYRQLDYPWHGASGAVGSLPPLPSLPRESAPLPVPTEPPVGPQSARPRANPPKTLAAKPRMTNLEIRR